MTTPILITVTGTIPLDGRLVFASETLVLDSDSNAVMPPREIVVDVEADVEFTVDIPATDDPEFNPTGWTWEVRPHFPGWKTTFNVVIPFDSPDQEIWFSELVPVPADGTGDLYALANHQHEGAGHNHTGIYDPAGTAAAAVATHAGAADPHAGYQLESTVVELIQDTVDTMLLEGDGVTLTYNDVAGTLTIDTDGGGAESLGGFNVLAHYNLKAVNGDPLLFTSSSPLSDGLAFYTRLWIPADTAITNLYAALVSAGSGHNGTSANNRIAIYEDDGTLAGQTADDPTVWTTVGWRGGAVVGGPIAAQGVGRFVYIGQLARGYDVYPGMALPGSPNDHVHKYTGPGTTKRRTFYAGGNTTFPATINPASTGTATGYMPLVGVN